MSKRHLILCALCLLSFGCGESSEDSSQPGSGTSTSTSCSGAKCDIPTDRRDYSWDVACENRRKDILQGNRQTFSPDAIRWSCGDVAGVNAKGGIDDRGQEYCEYFAMVALPEGEKTNVVELGRILSEEQNEEFGRPVPLTTSLELELSGDQIDWLDDNGDEAVGRCIFTSWHEDTTELACAKGDASCAPLLGETSPTSEIFRMKLPLNSNEAARDLLRQCLEYTSKDAYSKANEDEKLADDFMRGCRLADDLFSTGWRFSDAALCSSMMRLAECECAPLSSSEELEALVDTLLPSVPTEGSIKGFPLGSWSELGSLPSGCSYIEEEDAGRTLVGCDIYGFDVIDNQKDLKGFCQKRYGQNVAVWVPVPQEKLSCGNEDAQCTGTPWALQSTEGAN